MRVPWQQIVGVGMCVCVCGDEVSEGLALSYGAVSKVQGRLSEDWAEKVNVNMNYKMGVKALCVY